MNAREPYRDYFLYWGDLHRSSTASGGVTSMEEHFRVLRHELKLDFMALADNACLATDPTQGRFFFQGIKGKTGGTEGATLHNLHRIMAVHRISAEDWATLQRLVREYYEEGTFVPFLGYEWCSNLFGDHNVYFASGEGELILPDTVAELYHALRDKPVLLIPHHTGYARGRRGKNWNFHHPRLERLAEIHSLHGCSEKGADNPLPLWNLGMGTNVSGNNVQDALLRGYKLGFLSGSDCHGAPGQHILAGIFSPRLSRPDLFEGLWERRTIATSGTERIPIYFSADGHLLGSIFSTDRHPIFSLAVEGAGDLDKVEILKNNQPIFEFHPTGKSLEVSVEDQTGIDRPDNFFYVRVAQKNGALAWSSPIWVSFLPEHPQAQGKLYWETEDDLFFGVTRGKKSFMSGDILQLNCRNRNLEKNPVTDVRFEVEVQNPGGPKQIIPSQGSVSRLPAGEIAHASMTLPGPIGPASQICYRVRYLDFHQNSRAIDRHLLTEE